MIRKLIMITAALSGLGATAKGLEGSEKQLAAILYEIRAYGADPMFRCFQIGRLQSFNDVLAFKVKRLSSRTLSNPEQQALLVSEAQNMHLAVYKSSGRMIEPCDIDFVRGRDRLPSGVDVRKLLIRAKADLRRMRAQDPVIKCFHTGRLSYLLGQYAKDVRRLAARGTPADPRSLRLLQETTDLVRAAARNCNASEIN